MMFNGVRIVENDSLVDPYEDWSGVRSVGRATRRRKYHRQNIVTRYKPKTDVFMLGDTMVMHPAVAAELRRLAAAPALSAIVQHEEAQRKKP